MYWQLTDEDGLPSNTSYNIAQDSLGFIWIGTSNGITRFDGKGFKSYSNPEMLDNEIFNLQVDRSNRVWFNNLSGQIFKVEGDSCKLIFDIQKYDPFALTCFYATEENLIVGLSDNNNVTSGSLLIKPLHSKSTGDSITILQQPKVFYKIYPSFYRENEVSAVFFEKRENLNSPFDIYRIFLPIDSLIKGDFDLSNSKIRINYKEGRFNFYSDPNRDEFHVYYHERLEVFQISKDTILKLFSPNFNNRINYVIPFGNKSIILFQSGFRILNKVEYSGLYLPEFEFNHGLKDKEGNLWLLTNSDGVIIIPNLNNGLVFKESVTSLDKVQDTELAVGLTGPRIGFIDKTSAESFSFPGKNNISVIKRVKNNEQLYLVGTNIEIRDYNRENPGKSKIIYPKPHATKDLLLVEDTLFIGNYSTIKKVNYKAGEILNNLYLYEPILKKRTYKLYQKEDGTIIIGTFLGVYIYKNGKVSKISYSDGKDFNGNITNILSDTKGNLWIGCNGLGIFKLKDEKVDYSLNEDYPGLSLYCWDFDFDDDNNFWVGTPNGLFHLDPLSRNIEVFNKSNGLPTNEVHHVKCLNNKVFLGTEKGLISLTNEGDTGFSVSPPVFISSAYLLGGKEAIIDGSYDHDQNFFNFEFLGLSYISKGGLSYEYRMLGLDSNWVKTQTNLLQFPGLVPGKYEFQVKAINAKGIKSSNPATFKFTILPPWYQTWWFYLGLLLTTIAIVWLIFQNRYQNIKRREKMKRDFSERVNRLRMEALQTQMNPHFIFNAMNAIQHYLTISDGENAMRYLAKFARLIRLIFEQSKEKDISLEEELELLDLYLHLESLRFGEKVHTEILLEEGMKEQKEFIRIPPLIIQPLVENSFRHGLFHKKAKGSLYIKFEIVDNRLKCTIEDDGIGMDKSAQMKKQDRGDNHRSSGIQSAKERLAILHNTTIKEVELLNYFKITDLSQVSGYTSGTRVELTF
ncbi:MAG: histidine kinase [Saprospiraceae bacterium]